MKLKNVHYECRGNDIWRIYFKDYKEMETFQNERVDGKKPTCGTIIKNGLEIRWYVEAKLTGSFSILRRYVKDPTNDYFSNDIWRALVKKIEGADADYIFDEIDLWYDATTEMCYFKICCMNGTWTDFFVKNMLNSQFGMVAQENGYYDTDKEPKQLLKNITDVVRSTTKVIGCSTLYYYNLYFNDKSDLKNVNDKHINGSMVDSFKGMYYIRVVSYNKELPKNISSVTLVWDQEENRYSVEDFTIKGYRSEGNRIWLSTGTLWSNNDYLARVQALTPPPVPYWVNIDEDGKIGFRQKDMDEVQKEIDEATKRVYEKLEIKQVKDFDTDAAWHEYLSATEMARLGADFDGDIVEPIDLINRKEKEANKKEDNNMKIYWDESQPRIENVRDIVLSSYKYDRSVYYYRVYFERVVDAKNVMECSYSQDKGRHCWYYMTIASTAELSEEMKGSIKTLYLTYDKDATRYYINWKAMYGTPLKASAHFEMKMTAQLNDEQLKAWEAALGIDKLPKHKKEKTVQDVFDEFTEEQKKAMYYLIAEAQKSGKAENLEPTKILIQGTATIIWWSDGTKTIVKCQKGDKMDPEKGIAMCVMKKFMGTNETHSNYLDFAKDAVAEYEKQQAAEKAKKKAEADKKRRAAAKKKGAAGNANYKRGAKAKTEPESKEKEHAEA